VGRVVLKQSVVWMVGIWCGASDSAGNVKLWQRKER
jgi:hypothetical protein